MNQRKEEKFPRSQPPLPPPLPKFRVFSKPKTEESITNREIAKFWRQKRINEEDHLLAAIKAAARLRARTLTEQEYRSFEFSLDTTGNDYDETTNEIGKWINVGTNHKTVANVKEVRVGIKDWWTKSKYAYLNQPAIDSMDPFKKRKSTYIPNWFCYQPKSFYPSAIGVF